MDINDTARRIFEAAPFEDETPESIRAKLEQDPGSVARDLLNLAGDPLELINKILDALI